VYGSIYKHTMAHSIMCINVWVAGIYCVIPCSHEPVRVGGPCAMISYTVTRIYYNHIRNVTCHRIKPLTFAKNAIAGRGGPCEAVTVFCREGGRICSFTTGCLLFDTNGNGLVEVSLSYFSTTRHLYVTNCKLPLHSHHLLHFA